MREIKFRIWDIQEKNFLIKDEALKRGDIKEKIEEIIDFDNCSVQINNISNERFIFLQYTGFHDTGEKEIYEGDIVKVVGLILETEDFVGVVRFSDCGYILENAKKEAAIFLFQECVDMFVVGNIYQNKELLEVRE